MDSYSTPIHSHVLRDPFGRSTSLAAIRYVCLIYSMTTVAYPENTNGGAQNIFMMIIVLMLY